MHQRRKAPDGHIIDSAPHQPSNANHPSSTNSGRTLRRLNSSDGYRHRFDLLSYLIIFFSLLMVSIEIIAYRSLNDIDTTSPSPPYDNSPKINTNANQATSNIRQEPSEPKKTVAPTTPGKGYRLKSAIRNSHKNSFYWKTHTPDEVPPLPPDTDERGNKLPPIVAYVVTLTKCSSKKSSMDGAAVLMHSVRRNSYGWTPPFHDASNDDNKQYYPYYGGQGGKYRYRMYAIVDPEASPNDPSSKGDCARFLQKLGYGEYLLVYKHGCSCLENPF